VETIFAFVNTIVPLCAEGLAHRGACTAPDLKASPNKINDDLRQLFIGRDNAPGRIVFEGGADALQDIITDLAADVRGGHPAVACRDHKVVPNAFFSIVEPYTAHICWFYLEWAQDWADKLDRTAGGDLVRALAERQGDFVRFPHYETFFENSLTRPVRDAVRSMASVLERVEILRAAFRKPEGSKRVIQLRPEQIQALTNFTAWAVCDAAEDGQIVLPASLSRIIPPRLHNR
jgi:hypothetical protein